MLKRLKKLFSQRRYLLHLTAAYVLMLLIPCFAALLLLFNSSYNQMLGANAESGADALRRFSASFSSSVTAMRQTAYKLALSTRDTQEGVYLLGTVEPASNNYYFAEAITLLDKYSAASGRYMAVYYRADDVLLDVQYRYTADSYARYAYRNLSDERMEALKSFLRDSADQSGACFSDGDKLLVGFPVQIGAGRREALVFFRLTGTDFRLSQFGSETAQVDYYIYDGQGGLMLTTAASPEADMAAPPSEEGLRHMNDGYVARYVRASDGLIYALSMRLDSTASGMIRFFTQIRGLFGATMALLVLLAAAVIYLNYRPIGKIVSRIQDDRTGDEIADIGRYIERLNSEMSEQNLLLMDYLLGNLLRGAPIPVGELDRTGLTRHAGFFCVLTLFHRSVNTQLRMELTQLLQREFDVQVFITDILGRDQVVFITLLTSPAIEPVERAVRSWLTTHLAYPLELNAGAVVSSINGICASYQSSLPDGDTYGREEEENSQSQILLLRDEILAYLQQNYTDPGLCQISVADTFGISTYSLSRLFKKHVGIGFSEYITGKRLEAAKNLLAHTQKGVAEIASEVGISNANYFSRLFKTNVGMSPLKYRENEQAAPF